MMMKPLLHITTTPAKYEYEVARAKLEISQDAPEVERVTKRAALNMRREAGQLRMSSVRRRSDMGFKGVVERATYDGEKGQQSAQQATADYVEFGNQIAQAHQGVTIPDTLWQMAMQRRNQGDLMLVPLSSVDIQYMPSSLAMNFNPGEVRADWCVGQARLDYSPPSFQVNFTQYPSIQIEYLGDPLYVPPSANPHYDATV